jgi:peptidoglycan DL-endopeptidase CwlO
VAHGRKRVAGAFSGLALAATIGVVGLVPIAPAQAEPDIDDVQAQVDKLYREAEQASERLNDAKLSLNDLRGDLVSLKADEARQDDKLEAVRDELQGSIIDHYEGQSLSAVGQVAIADDPDAFVASLSTMSAYNDLQKQHFDDYATEAKALDLRRKATAQRAAKLEKTQAQLADEKQTIDDKLAEAKSLLADLKEEERAAMLSRGSVRLPSGISTSGRAKAALDYAMAQVGDAYVYGAAGPSAYDCSGLTMMAWAQAGVALPHSSSAQYSSGPHIPASQLQPGDLVFYYSPISHVAMYIGNGLIVEAANPGAGVRVSGLYSMPYVGAVRPG